MNWTKANSAFEKVLMVLAVIALVSVIWNHFKPAPLPEAQWSKTEPAKGAEGVKTVYVQGPERIVTVEKEKIVEKLKLPDEIKNNPDQQVIATAEVPAHKAPTDVVATLNTKTGEGSIIARPRKPAFFEFVNDKEIGARYGISTQGTAADIYGRWDFVRVGPATIGAYGELGLTERGKSQAKAQISVSYKF